MPNLPATDSSLLDRLCAILKESQSFCLSGHENPDADVIGSELAMASLIRRLGSGKRVDIINHGPVPKSVSFLPGAQAVQNLQKVEGVYDAVIVFECSGEERMGGIIRLAAQAKNVINIDHHLHNPNFGHVNFVEPKTSSTAELIFKIFEHAKMAPTKEEAVCLYTGLVADTGWFRYSNTNSQTHRIASALVASGVPVAELAERVYMSRSHTSLKLLGWVLSNMKLYHDNRVAVLKIPQAVFQSYGASPDDLEEFVNFGLQIESVCASALLKEKENSRLVKISLRSKEKYDINQVARSFGGGGHKNASGCALDMSLDDAEAALAAALGKIFK